jgi:glyoxylase-like metal-dependent hydrolase (beta-lactamase superfamily II)
MLVSCRQSTHSSESLQMGKMVSTEDMEKIMDQPGPIELQSVASADWAVDFSGLVNLDHDKAKAQNLKDHLEPIQIYTYLFHHPTQGDFLVDTGLSEKVMNNPSSFGFNWLLQKVMHLDQLKLLTSTEKAIEGKKLSGVFLTHMHVDHITGLPAVAADVPLYAGPTEVGFDRFMNLFTQSLTDQLIGSRPAVKELIFQPDPSAKFSGVLDVFQDQSVFVIHSPGHTPGSLAFVLRTTEGPVLIAGDTCHTKWGWENEVEPGQFTTDRPLNAKSLVALKELSRRHPNMKVKLGHQN